MGQVFIVVRIIFSQNTTARYFKQETVYGQHQEKQS